MIPWHLNDKKFFEEAKKAYPFQEIVAQNLSKKGFKVEVPNLSFRGNLNIQDFDDKDYEEWQKLRSKSLKHRTEYLNTKDIVINDKFIVEVKSRNLYFTCPDDFPYKSIIIDTVSGYEAKDPKPSFYFCISQKTKEIIYTVGDSPKNWIKRNAFDRVREINELNYECPKDLWQPFSEFKLTEYMHSVKFVPASGTCESGLMIIGEAPGETEDKEGRPFCGRAGKLLDKMLDYMKLNRENVYITNCVKVRPTNEHGQNRTPTDEELESWKSLLIGEINEIKPRVILTLGSCATRTLLNTTEGITKLRGKGYWVPDYLPLYHWECVIIPTYHPAYLLRKSGDKEINSQVKKDLKSVRKILNIE